MFPLAISAWVQYASGSYQNGTGIIFDDSDTTPSNDFEFGVRDSTNAIIVATKNGVTLSQVVPLGRSISNAWVQLVWVSTGSGSIVYLNGVSIYTTTQSGNNIGLHAPPVIGATSSESPFVAFFGGKIDDLRIYNRALSLSEVQQLYALESGPLVTFVKAFTVDYSNLTLGFRYVLQASSDLSNWTNYSTPFFATNVNFTNIAYQRIDDWNKLFFRIQRAP